MLQEQEKEFNIKNILLIIKFKIRYIVFEKFFNFLIFYNTGIYLLMKIYIRDIYTNDLFIKILITLILRINV